MRFSVRDHTKVIKKDASIIIKILYVLLMIIKTKYPSLAISFLTITIFIYYMLILILKDINKNA